MSADLSASPPRTRRRPGGGWDRCPQKVYAEPYVARTKRRGTSEPWLSEDAFRELADWFVDVPEGCPFRAEEVRCGDIIFVKTDKIDAFLSYEHPRISQPYVLLNHASDYGMPSAVAEAAIAGAGQRHLERWFAANLYGAHPAAMSHIPLGLQGPGWWGGEGFMPPNIPGTFAFGVPILRAKLERFLAGNLSRELNLLVAFHDETNPGERGPAAQAAAALGYPRAGEVARDTWPATLQAHLFVMAPAGNGVDTHRMWEAVLNGAVPVVRRGVYEAWLECLPFVALGDWSELSDGMLRSEARRILAALDSGAFDFRRSMLDFHAARIERAALRAEAKCSPEARAAAAAARAADAAAFAANPQRRRRQRLL